MNIGAETENIEFKKTTGELKEGIISLTSMLNKNGYGVLYFGVKDNGDVIGQQIGDRTLRDVSQAIAYYVKPQIIPTITLELIDDKNVIKVSVQGSEKPYSAYGKYYMRSADEDRELSPEQLRVMMFKKSEIDVISHIESTDQELSFGQLKTLFATKGLTVNKQFEKNVGLFTENKKYNLMAMLLADHNDISIKVVTFRTNDKSELIKRNEYGGKCLLVAMDQVLSYMEAINDTNVEMNAKQRKEESLFDLSSFREAWVNACLHTRWDKLNPPAVYIFNDRIEVISTGGLPEDLTEEEFFMGISRPINIQLQKIFGQLGYVEQTGHGIPLIIHNYGKQAFTITKNYINVIIPFNRKNIVEKKYNPELNQAENQLLELIRSNPKYTIKDLEIVTEYSDSYIKKIIKELKENHLIERVGSNKGGYWKVNN